MTLSALRAWGRYQYGRHGWPALLGLALLGLALGWQTFGLRAFQVQLDETRTQAESLRRRLVQAPARQEENRKRQALAYASLPAAAGALEAVAALHRSAAAHGVQLANGEYRLARETGSGLQRYQITLPSRSSYPQWRAWVGEVMNEMPAAALDEVNLRREDAGSSAVEARLRLTLFMRGR